MIPAVLNLAYYPRTVLSLENGINYFHKETAGQVLVLRPSPLITTQRLICRLAPTFGALHAGSSSLNVSYSTVPAVGDDGLLSCPLPIVWDPDLDHLWLTLQIEGSQE